MKNDSILMKTMGKMIALLLIALSINVTLTHANPKPLNIAVHAFDPPFITQISEKTFYGFDVSMISFICKKLNINCKFVPTSSEHFEDYLTTQKADVAVSATILPFQSKKNLALSVPYLKIKCAFITLKQKNLSFDLRKDLQNKSIGITDREFFNRLLSLSNHTAKPVFYENDSAMIYDLKHGKIDLGLIDLISATFYVNNSAGQIVTTGEPIDFGYVRLLSVKENNHALLNQLNLALKQFISSHEYKKALCFYLGVSCTEAFSPKHKSSFMNSHPPIDKKVFNK